MTHEFIYRPNTITQGDGLSHSQILVSCFSLISLSLSHTLTIYVTSPVSRRHLLIVFAIIAGDVSTGSARHSIGFSTYVPYTSFAGNNLIEKLADDQQTATVYIR